MSQKKRLHDLLSVSGIRIIIKTPRTGFGPVSRARQARMIGRYTIGAFDGYLETLYKIINSHRIVA